MGDFFWQLLLGIVYAAFGFVLMTQPVVGALIVTFCLGVLFVASGLSRIFLTLRHWQEAGWLMLLSGVFGVLAGIAILVGWPATGLVVLGYLLGIDLIFHGYAWSTYASRPAVITT
jgi:uncharacterized membrane protein HdeD (DUF308 family)